MEVWGHNYAPRILAGKSKILASPSDLLLRRKKMRAGAVNRIVRGIVAVARETVRVG